MNLYKILALVGPKVYQCVLGVILCCYSVDARAIPDPSEDSYDLITLPGSLQIEVKLQKALGKVSFLPDTSIIDFEDYRGGDLKNTRFTNVKSLEGVIKAIETYKALTPKETIWAVFDMDETLIDRQGGGRAPIHPDTNTLLQKLVDQGVPILLLTMGTDPKPKFQRAGLKYDGVISDALISWDSKGLFIPKGKRLIEYIETFPEVFRPSHVFFMDDMLRDPFHWGQPFFIESVEESLKRVGISFTTFHFTPPANP